MEIEAGCKGKRDFPTRAEAEATIAFMRKGKRLKPGANAYRCEHCYKWHIGRG